MTKFGLLIGINYTDTDSELNGCHNDVLLLKQVLVDKLDYIDDNITILIDDPKNSLKPTRAGILKQLNDIIDKSNEIQASEMIISYSGHGSYTIDTSGDELDKKDEIICPSDYLSSGIITDDEFSTILSRLNEDCICTLLLDCCHSGTFSDLNYKYWYNIETKKWCYYTASENKNGTNKFKAKIISISGCNDDQSSMGTFKDNKWSGALTRSFTDLLNKRYRLISCGVLLKNLNNYMFENNLEQKPIITTTFPIKSSHLFCKVYDNRIPFITTKKIR